jgi:hypothetical protein
MHVSTNMNSAEALKHINTRHQEASIDTWQLNVNYYGVNKDV